jgi:hypothetical protein
MALAAALAGCASQQGPAASPSGASTMPPAEAFRPAAQRSVASAFLLLPGARQRQLVNYAVVGDMAVMEGDVLLGPVQSLLLRYGALWGVSGDVKSAVAVSNKAYLWPNAEIPYVIDASIPPQMAGNIQWAINEAGQAGLRLRPRGPSDIDYVVFRDNGDGCNSYVGRVGGGQPINLSNGCGKGSALHEILHASGVHHEHSRGDRDQYVTIVWSEIAEGNRSAFEKRDAGASDIGPYDYGSIMHYSTTAFSRTGRPTIIPTMNAAIGQREGLSALDKAGLQTLYGGVGAVPSQPPLPNMPAASGSFAGVYTSSQGTVTCTQSGASVSCRSPSIGLFCVAAANDMNCAWSGGGQGNAVFRRQPSGVLAGTWGDFFSSDSRGAWDLVPTNAAAGAPAPPPAGQPGAWPFPWPQQLPSSPIPFPQTLPQQLPPLPQLPPFLTP